MKFHRNFAQVLFALAFLLPACGGEDVSQHYSDSGLIPEAFIPSDVGMITSYSSRDDEQYAAVQEIEKNLGDKNRVSETATEVVDTQFGEVGLDFERDLRPAFGDQFRMVYAVRSGGDEPESFTVTTLADPDQMKTVLDTLVEADQLTFKQLSDLDVYLKADSNAYVTIYEDLLLVATNPEDLVSMASLEEEDSLWGSEGYQDVVTEIGGDYVFYGIIYPALYESEVTLPSGFSVGDIPSLVNQQVLVVRAEENGFRFEAGIKADKDAAKEVGVSFDSIPRSEPYLFEEVPSEELMGYFESYGLQQTFEQADALGDESGALESLRTTIRQYFGMDFDTDILSFLDKGYAISAHKNGEGVVPGITLLVDISSNTEAAEEFINKLDGQLAGILMVVEAALPGAVIKDTAEWGDETFSRISIDLSKLPRSTESPLPTAVTDSLVQLVYGVEGDRLLISTTTNWDDSGTSVAESELYQKINRKIENASQGLILLDAQGLAEFTATLRALREQLGLQVSDQAQAFETFLQGFSGAAAHSETEAYESNFEGFLMIAD